MHAVVEPARNMHKSVKDDMKTVLVLWKRLTSIRGQASKSKSSFELMIPSCRWNARTSDGKWANKTPLKRKEESRSPPPSQNENAKKRREELGTPQRVQRGGVVTPDTPQTPCRVQRHCHLGRRWRRRRPGKRRTRRRAGVAQVP